MQQIIRKLYKVFRELRFRIARSLSWMITVMKFYVNGVSYKKDFISHGIPVVKVSLSGEFSIGGSFSINNGKNNNTIGRQQPCYFVVKHNARLIIGDNVGISCSAIICTEKIQIGNNVRIGGNCVIYDTDFHDLDAENRVSKAEDKSRIKTSPVILEDNTFIGAHTTILKGVTIGEHSIVGACSLVTRSIPPFEIWGGSPAKFIKKIDHAD